jgi:hypothetical protein
MKLNALKYPVDAARGDFGKYTKLKQKINATYSVTFFHKLWCPFIC